MSTEPAKGLASRLLSVYDDRGVLDCSGQRLIALDLHRHCPNRGSCWTDGEIDKMGKASWKNRIQLPHIGTDYKSSENRLLAVGLNLNEYGGLFSIRKLVVHVQHLLIRGCRKIHFGNPRADYAGSLFWHRLAAYATVLAQNDWTIDDNNVRWKGRCVFDCGELLSKTLDSVAFLELIKCSPARDRSGPLPGMWDKCPKAFLESELSILAPRCVLVLGKGTFNALRYSDPEYVDGTGKVLLYRMAVNNRMIPIVNVTHPTARGGNSSDILRSLADLWREHRGSLQEDKM